MGVENAAFLQRQLYCGIIWSIGCMLCVHEWVRVDGVRASKYDLLAYNITYMKTEFWCRCEMGSSEQSLECDTPCEWRQWANSIDHFFSYEGRCKKCFCAKSGYHLVWYRYRIRRFFSIPQISQYSKTDLHMSDIGGAMNSSTEIILCNLHTQLKSENSKCLPLIEFWWLSIMRKLIICWQIRNCRILVLLFENMSCDTFGSDDDESDFQFGFFSIFSMTMLNLASFQRQLKCGMICLIELMFRNIQMVRSRWSWCISPRFETGGCSLPTTSTMRRLNFDITVIWISCDKLWSVTDCSNDNEELILFNIYLWYGRRMLNVLLCKISTLISMGSWLY